MELARQPGDAHGTRDALDREAPAVIGGGGTNVPGERWKQMAEKKKEEKKDPQPPTKLDYEARLLSLLTPEGKKFATRLGRALREECASIQNEAGIAILQEIELHFLKSLDSIKTMNRLAAARTVQLVTCYYLIMNYAEILLASSRYHQRKGELNVTGQRLFEIWRIYAYRLMDMGEEGAGRIAAREAALTRNIEDSGSSGLSVVGAIKSLFGKGKSK